MGFAFKKSVIERKDTKRGTAKGMTGRLPESRWYGNDVLERPRWMRGVRNIISARHVGGSSLGDLRVRSWEIHCLSLQYDIAGQRIESGLLLTNSDCVLCR